MSVALNPDIDPLADDYGEREMARRHLRDCIAYCQLDYIVNPFGTQLADFCEDFLDECVAKTSPRYMAFAPPQHGKSLTVSRHLPAFGLGKYPGLRFVGASYGDTLAKSMSRDVIRIMEGDEYQRVFPGTMPAKRGNAEGRKRTDEFWELDASNQSGSYRARGVGQGLGGFPAEPLIIDDPYKDLTDAKSPAIRRKVWDWYAAVGLMRVQPGSGVFIMHTRWHQDDLAGKLIDAMENGQGSEWRILNLPAIATKDEEFRKEGEALCPHRYDLAALRVIERDTDDYIWGALYQQNPTTPGGSVFKTGWWQYYDPASPPRFLYRRMYADTAQKTKERNDYSVFQCWAMGFDGNIYLLDQVRDKWEAPDLLDEAVDFWLCWAPIGPNLERTEVLKIEDKSSGTGLIQQLEAGITSEGVPLYIPVEGIPRHTDKSIRASGVAPHIKNGRVFLPKTAPWLHTYKQEFADFTRDDSHSFDDQIDPTMDAIEDMLGTNRDIYRGAITNKSEFHPAGRRSPTATGK